MKCPNCSMNISDGARMCVHCGTSIQPFGSTVTQPVQNNMQIQQPGVAVQQQVPQGVPAQQQVPQVFEEKKNIGGKIAKIIFIIVLILGIGFGVYSYIKKKELDKKIQEEFEEEAEEYFQAVSIAVNADVFESEGKELTTGEFYYILIDNDIKDKDHPLTPKDDKDKKDKGYFDGKGYILVNKGYGSLSGEGFVCFNNGDDEKRYTSVQTMNVYNAFEGDTNNSFRELTIDKKGKCDINELLGATNYPLNKLTAKENK